MIVDWQNLSDEDLIISKEDEENEQALFTILSLQGKSKLWTGKIQSFGAYVELRRTVDGSTLLVVVGNVKTYHPNRKHNSSSPVPPEDYHVRISSNGAVVQDIESINIMQMAIIEAKNVLKNMYLKKKTPVEVV